MFAAKTSLALPSNLASTGILVTMLRAAESEGREPNSSTHISGSQYINQRKPLLSQQQARLPLHDAQQDFGLIVV
jgi:hypothetical protein